jgi:hypothetical protein
MSGIARDLESFRHALRDVDLDEREVHEVVDAASSWDLTKVEIWCSLFEKVREAGFLSRGEAGSADEYVPKPPGEWGSLSSIAGSTYTGDERRVGHDLEADTVEIPGSSSDVESPDQPVNGEHPGSIL